MGRMTREYSIVVAATATEATHLQYLVSISLPLWLNDSVTITDYPSRPSRTIKYIFLRRPPGHKGYPGDVFYLHSRLPKYAATMNDNFGGGSLTALDTQCGDVSAYM